MARQAHSAEVRAKALALAEVTTIAEAAKVTGVPDGTIKRWRAEDAPASNEPREPNHTPKKIEALAQQAQAEVVAEVKEHLTTRLLNLADSLYKQAETATKKIATSMDTEEHDRDGAAWLRSLVGAQAQGVEKAQLLSGKPTARPELKESHDYRLTFEFIERYPELLELARRDARFSQGVGHGGRAPISVGGSGGPDISSRRALPSAGALPEAGGNGRTQTANGDASPASQ